MAREPRFVFKEAAFNAALVKVDRNKVYGWSEIKYEDSNQQICSFINMLDDGRTMVGTGGIALKSIDEHGDEIDKSTLIAKYMDDTDAVLYPSVFDVDTVLSDDKSISDYLSMDVKSVYQLQFSESNESILELLKIHKVLYFSFNYRAGYDPDDAFLLHQGDNIFAVIGRLTNFSYSSLEIPSVLDDETEEAGDDLDFNMF